MTEQTILMPTSVVKKAARISDNQMIHFRQVAENDENMAAVLPAKPETSGKPRLHDQLQAALVCVMADFIAVDVKAPLAAKIARRIMDAHRDDPTVNQWAILLTDNGNVSTRPYSQSDLRTGYISGSRLRFAVVVDLCTYRERVDEAIADAPRVIGGSDDD